MEKKDIILVTIAFLGWSWGILQFIINRRANKRDKQIDRRFAAYSAYMKKVDELMNNVRTDPNMIYGIASDFLKVALNGNSEQISNAAIEYNNKLLDFVKKATEPLLIVRQELNSLLIVCSKKLYPKIEELSYLTTDFNNDMQKALSIISPNDSEKMAKQLKTIGHSDRWTRFKSLNEEIIALMRKELGNE